MYEYIIKLIPRLKQYPYLFAARYAFKVLKYNQLITKK